MSEVLDKKERTIKATGKVDFAEKMNFKAFHDVHFKKPIEDESTHEQLAFTVQVNPDSLTRSFSTKTVENKKIRSESSSGEGAGFDSENYSFDLIFDGTGALGASSIGKADEYFQKFLSTVYAKKTLKAVKKEANFVELNYCGDTFYCKLSSLTAKYTMFGRNGSPLRIKASCTFISVDKDKPDPPPKKAKEATKSGPDIPDGADPKASIDPGDSYEETVNEAKKNGSSSLMNCRQVCD